LGAAIKIRDSSKQVLFLRLNTCQAIKTHKGVDLWLHCLSTKLSGRPYAQAAWSLRKPCDRSVGGGWVWKPWRTISEPCRE
jgi:hypothetical protein